MAEKIQKKEISTEQIMEALRTVPLPAFTAEIGLNFNGVCPYACTDEAYIDACKRHSILPIKIRFEYDHNEDEFFVKDFEPSEIFYSYQNAGIKNKKGVYALLAHGSHKHINAFSYRIGPLAHKGLKTFVERELNSQIENGYKFQDIAVVFAENSLDRPDTQMLLMGGSLDLRVGSCINDKDAAKLSRWFKKLKKKYER